MAPTTRHEPSGGRAARRQSAARRRTALIGAAGLVLASVGVVIAVSGGDDAPRREARAEPTTTTTTLVPQPQAFTVATTKVEELTIRAAPDPTSEALATLEPTSGYLSPTTLLIDPDREPQAGFLPVAVPLEKPNNQPGWVSESEVTLSQTAYEIHVNLEARTLELRQGDTVVLESKVIIGTAETPTPTGRFFVTDPVNCNEESVPGYPVAQCSGAYGAFAIGTSGLSEKLDSFDGTIPQIAVHGTNLPDTELGKDLSNGCIRVPNDVILAIARIQPLLGTPVVITAEEPDVRVG